MKIRLKSETEGLTTLLYKTKVLQQDLTTIEKPRMELTNNVGSVEGIKKPLITSFSAAQIYRKKRIHPLTKQRDTLYA